VAPSKMHGRKRQEWKTRHEMTWVENAGVEKVARYIKIITYVCDRILLSDYD